MIRMKVNNMETRQYRVIITYITLDGKKRSHTTLWYFSPIEAWNEAHRYEDFNSHKWSESSAGISSRKVY